MSKVKKQYICNNCGSINQKWSGQCDDCQAWGTIQEESISASKILVPKTGAKQKLYLSSDINIEDNIYFPTAINELNRVLGGGIISASTVLIGGSPGIGKSTLLLQLACSISQVNLTCLYITGEESLTQIKLRAKRLALNDDKLKLLAANNLEDIIATMDHHKSEIDMVIIDSVQTLMTDQISSSAGTVSQVRTCTDMLINYAKQNNITIFFTCHVNKDGQLAGPKVLEHMVDTVLYFEGDHNNHFRILRSMKNRFGAINEIGVFEMTRSGLIEVQNPSELFLMQREYSISGNAVFAAIEGSRSLLVEIQALIAPTNMATPRRSVVGWDHNRLAMIIAVLNVRFGLNLTNHEVYLNIAGGIRIHEPAADLAVAAALISATNNKALPAGSIFFGEIGLSGEIRKASMKETRIKESIKLGFKKIYCQSDNDKQNNIISLSHIKQLQDLLLDS